MKKSKPIIDKYGTKIWYLNGKSHRNDGLTLEIPKNNYNLKGNIKRSILMFLRKNIISW